MPSANSGVETHVAEKPAALHESVGLKGASLQAEYDTIMNVLKEVKYNKSKAAEKLNIDRKTLYNKLKFYNIILIHIYYLMNQGIAW